MTHLHSCCSTHPIPIHPLLPAQLCGSAQQGVGAGVNRMSPAPCSSRRGTLAHAVNIGCIRDASEGISQGAPWTV